MPVKGVSLCEFQLSPLLPLDIVRQPLLQLSGRDGLLSARAVAGQQSSVPFIVSNSGTAAADNITLSASAPTGWKVTFEPSTIERLVPGKEAEVQALLTPGDKSLAGDYMTTISAASRGEAASSQFRITVVTSTVWGMAGAGVIGVALLLMARRLATIPGVSMLRLFTVDRAPLPSFVAILGFLIPLMAIGLGFDAVNSEQSRHTLSRILAQPIYRDALLIGKFLAGLATLAVSLAALWLLVIGLGLIFLGVPPGGEDMARSLAFLVVAICYAGVWLSLAMLLSIVFRSSSTSALVALGIRLFLTVLWPILAPALAQAIAPPDPRYELLGLSSPDTAIWTQILGRLSPNDLFGEAMLAVLSPSTRALGPVFLDQLRGAVMRSPLPLEESLIIAWPQTVALIAVAILLFAAGYVVFQRQEIRA